MILDLYLEFLNYFWLRPENAVLSCFRSSALKQNLKKLKKNDRVLDVSCGDGVFSFITCDGRLNLSSDAFSSIKNNKRSSKFDAYDHFDRNFKISIKKKPEFLFETGLDWKINLLKKAEKLNFYKNLTVHNNEKKFKNINNNYDLIFSNSAYWVKNLESHINDMVDATKVGGKIYLQMKFKDSMNISIIKNNSNINFGREFYNMIDAGRLKTWRGLITQKEFIKIIKKNKKVKIIDFSPLYGDLISLIWDIGFRPLFKPLFLMTSNLKKSSYLEIKKEWVSTLYRISKYYISSYMPEKNKAMEYNILLKKM